MPTKAWRECMYLKFLPLQESHALACARQEAAAISGVLLYVENIGLVYWAVSQVSFGCKTSQEYY